MDVVFKGAAISNFSIGGQGKKPNKIILHWIVGTLESADRHFQNPSANVSAHYGIGDRDIHQYVREKDTAYHAGSWDINLKSIGIEHEGSPTMPITNATYESSAWLVADIADRNKITLNRKNVIGHREVQATACPGTVDIDRIIARAKQIQGGTMPNELSPFTIRRAIEGAYLESTGKLPEDWVIKQKVDYVLKTGSFNQVLGDIFSLKINYCKVKDCPAGDQQNAIDKSLIKVSQAGDLLVEAENILAAA